MSKRAQPPGSERRRICGLGVRAACVWFSVATLVIALFGLNLTSSAGASAPNALAASSSATAKVTPATFLSKVSQTATPATVGTLSPANSGDAHSCSASVLDTPEGNLILTAAHCLSGTGVGMRFVPGYDNGSAPYGTWTVTAAYAPQGWLSSGAATDDMAVLKVANQTINGVSRSVESVVGGEVVGASAQSGTVINTVAYSAGTGGSALTCTSLSSSIAADNQNYPMFTCGSYPQGTSGGPWITTVNGRSTVVGLIGGYKQGGCSNETSYSPRLTDLPALISIARTSAGQSLPTPPGSGC